MTDNCEDTCAYIQPVLAGLRAQLAAKDRELEALREAMAEFGEHKRNCCPLADWRAGQPTDDGGYEMNFGGEWYPRGEYPACECGLAAALAEEGETDQDWCGKLIPWRERICRLRAGHKGDCVENLQAAQEGEQDG